MEIDDPGKINVIGLGQACFDCLGTVPQYPSEDSKTEINELFFQTGGPVAAALITLSQLGVPSSFMGSISDDFFGTEILNGLKRENIDTSHLKIVPGFSSQFAFISLNGTHQTRNVFWRRSTAPFMSPQDISLKPFKRAKILHMDGLMIDASMEAARQAKDLGIRIVIDAGTLRDGFLDLIPFADFLITSEKFVQSVVAENTYDPRKGFDILRKYTACDIIITRGNKGSIGLINDDIIIQKAYPVNAVNTNGAGDVYHGAYIFGIIKGWQGRECMRFASAASAMKCEHIVFKKDLLSLKKINIFMDKHNFS